MPPETGNQPSSKAKTTSSTRPSQYCGRPAKKASKPDPSEERSLPCPAVSSVEETAINQASTVETEIRTIVGPTCSEITVVTGCLYW